MKAGYASPIRTPRGRDVMAACGQLKSLSIKQKKLNINARKIDKFLIKFLRKQKKSLIQYLNHPLILVFFLEQEYLVYVLV